MTDVPQVTPLPAAPSRGQDPAIFIQRADAFVDAMVKLVPELNAFAPQLLAAIKERVVNEAAASYQGAAAAAAAAAASAASIDLHAGTTQGKVPLIGPGDVLPGSLIPITLGHLIDVQTPENSGTTGGLRVRATTAQSAIPNTAFIQITDHDITAELGYLLFRAGYMLWNGVFDLPNATAATRDLFLANQSTYVPNIAGLWLAASPAGLADQATIPVDMGALINAYVVLGGNRTLASPTRVKPGQSGYIVITQDGTGGRTLSFGTAWKFGGQVPTLSTTPNARDVLYYTVLNDGSVDAYLSKAR